MDLIKDKILHLPKNNGYLEQKKNKNIGQYELDVVEKLCDIIEVKKKMNLDIVKLEKMFSKKWKKPIKDSNNLFKVLIRQLRRNMNQRFSHKNGFRNLNVLKSKKYKEAVDSFGGKMLKKITVNYERIKQVGIQHKLKQKSNLLPKSGKKKKGKKPLKIKEESEPEKKELDNKKHMPIRISDLEENLQHLFAYYLGFESVDELYQNQPNIFFKKIGIVNLPV